MSSRRKFIQTAGLHLAGLSAASALPAVVKAAQPVSSLADAGINADSATGPHSVVTGGAGVDPAAAAALPTSLALGIAGYTFLKVPLDAGIAMMKRTGVTALSIKDFYLPLNSTDDTIHAVSEKFRSNGLTIYAAGVIYMKTQAEVDRAFEYAKTLGVSLIVGVPNPELIAYTEEKVKSYNIRVAIHNHGPEDKLYPSPADVYNRIKGLDPRMGLCLDIGHATRAGADPVKVVGEYAPRIFDLHIKDLAVVSKEARPIELGRGVLDIPGLVKALKKIHYTGYCSIEHEMDMTDPFPGIAESAGFFRGVLKTLDQA